MQAAACFAVMQEAVLWTFGVCHHMSPKTPPEYSELHMNSTKQSMFVVTVHCICRTSGVGGPQLEVLILE